MTTHRDEILRLRDEGKTYREIQALLGCSKGTISFHCSKRDDHAATVQTHRLERARAAGTVSSLHEETRRLCDWMLRLGINRRDIADVLGVGVHAVSWRARKLGIVREPAKSNYLGTKNRRLHLKILGVVHLGGACTLCGYRKCLRALEFHHKDPSEKEFHISRSTSMAWGRVKAELAKCDLVCANCHREIHDGWGISFPQD